MNKRILPAIVGILMLASPTAYAQSAFTAAVAKGNIIATVDGFPNDKGVAKIGVVDEGQIFILDSWPLNVCFHQSSF